MLFLFPTPRFMLTLYWSNGARVMVIIIIFVYSALVVCFIEQPEAWAFDNSSQVFLQCCEKVFAPFRFLLFSFIFFFAYCHTYIFQILNRTIFFTLFLESCVHFSLPHLGLILGRSVKSIKQNLSTTFHKMKEPKRS